ncbi:hypothetical protein ABIA13_006379 [Sinorhizobium fredii]
MSSTGRFLAVIEVSTVRIAVALHAYYGLLLTTVAGLSIRMCEVRFGSHRNVPAAA